ncbi:MAG: hypothetical protein KA177_00535 [Paludibacter sp.]|nr:hypothetical protein [Paludibacter sp.]MBP8782740.1 hypothetical protein [Paludibacter sp.]
MSHSDKASASQQITSILKNLKDKTGETIRISINKRTTIELPACLTQAEQDARVANYMKLHNI